MLLFIAVYPLPLQMTEEKKFVDAVNKTILCHRFSIGATVDCQIRDVSINLPIIFPKKRAKLEMKIKQSIYR